MIIRKETNYRKRVGDLKVLHRWNANINLLTLQRNSFIFHIKIGMIIEKYVTFKK